MKAIPGEEVVIGSFDRVVFDARRFLDCATAIPPGARHDGLSLAIDQSAKGQGLGEHLLLDALRRSLAHADQIAAMAMVVDAKGEAAGAIYRHYGLVTLQAQPSRLFVPMRLVAHLFGWMAKRSSSGRS